MQEVQEEEGAGFAVYLDSHRLRTPAKENLLLPIRALADALAAEWQAQGDTINPQEMLLMRFVSTAIDKIAPDPEPQLQEFVNYGLGDLLIYRATHPDSLVAEQNAKWNPPLAWAADTYNINLQTSTSLTAPQDEGAAAALRAAANADCHFRLAGLAYGAGLLGSAVLSLALADYMDAKTAYDAACLDEEFQAAQWGADEEAAARLAKIKLEIEGLVGYFAALKMS